MSWDTIIVALITLFGSLAGTYFSNQKSAALMAYRLQQLEDKVNKHNNLVQRMYAVEKDMATAFLKIDELRKDVDAK